jgi:hypothetical protein
MPETVREWIYGCLMVAMVVLLIVGTVMLVMFQAGPLEVFIAGLGLLALGGLAFLGARKLKGQQADEDLKALSDYISGKKVIDQPKRNGN